MKLRSGKHPRGFTLLEVLGWLVLLAALSFLLAEIFAISSRIMREVPERQAATVRVDTAINHLRRDVWSATAIRIPDDAQGRRIEFDTPAGIVVWLSQDGELKRSTPQDVERTWTNFPLFQFSTPSKAAVQIQVQVPKRPPESVVFISQRMLGGNP